MKKRILSIMLMLCMVLTLVPTTVFANTTSDGFEYDICDGVATILGYRGDSVDVVIPSKIKGYTVTRIDCYAFLNCENIKSITIPEGVTQLESAFGYCPKLENFFVDEKNQNYSSVDGVLFNKNQTKLVQYPTGKSATSYSIPKSVTSISTFAFDGCLNLTSMDIPNNIVTISGSAFKYCRNLGSVTFQANSQLKSIDGYAFGYCTSLASIDIPDSVTYIGEYAFAHCPKLESINISNGVTSIENNAFNDCPALTSIKIPYSVTSIGNYAFDSCPNLESIFIPDKDNLSIGTKAIPDTTSQIKYVLDTNKGGIVITSIDLKNGMTSVAIPEKISGYHVVGISDESLLSKMSSHTCIGGTATCTTKALCSICGKGHGELLDHNLDYIPAKDATVTETGNIEYWKCQDCDSLFSDETGKNEISPEEIVIEKLPPDIIKGTGQSITAGDKKALSFTSNAAYSDFDHVELDGKTLDKKNYTVEEGSTIVTLDADFVSSLAIGEHTIAIVSKNGTASTTFMVNAKDSQSTQTGDNSQIALWITVLFVSGSILLYTKKKKYN